MDIAMCLSETCPSRSLCHRHEASGTRPDPHRQTYTDFQHDPETGKCDDFWPKHPTKITAATPASVDSPLITHYPGPIYLDPENAEQPLSTREEARQRAWDYPRKDG